MKKERGKIKKSVVDSLPAFDWQISDKSLLFLTLALAVLYYVYSFFSDGFYQHDEAAHFINMKMFWFEPNQILGNWAKPGYKLLYVVPVLLGVQFVTFVNALFSAFTAFFVYKLARELNLRLAFLAFLLLATQPLWIQLSFRNYSEIPTAFLLSVACWLFYREKWLFLSLIISYLTLLRQEFYVIAVFLAGFLLFKKQFLSFVLLAVFPLLIHVWGWMATGDPLYLISSTLGTASTYKDAYPRLGFDHYFRMISTIAGPLAVLGVLFSLWQIIKEKQKTFYAIAGTAVIYFLIHCVFNWQSVKIGASTGGNLRYILVISPLLALLAAHGIGEVTSKIKKPSYAWVISVAFILISLFFLSYTHNNIVFTSEKTLFPFWFALLFTAALFFIPPKGLVTGLMVVQIAYLVAMVKPYKRSEEDKTVAQMVEWAKNQRLFENPTMIQHSLIYYFYGKVQPEFKSKNYNLIVKETIDEAPKGTIIFYDTHYSYRPELRPTSVSYTYFTSNPEQFKILRQFVAQDKRFAILVVEKLN